MLKFYLYLWAFWSLRVSFCGIILACGFTAVIIGALYADLGAPSLEKDVYTALVELFNFWFKIVWSLTLLLALFRSLKYVFNRCYNGFKLELLACGNNEVIKEIGYGDLVKVWRKWFMLMIWLVASMMVISLVVSKFLFSYESLFEWFNIYILFTFILCSGFFSFVVLGGRCKRMRVNKC